MAEGLLKIKESIQPMRAETSHRARKPAKRTSLEILDVYKRQVVEAAHAEGKKAGICGEIAADTELTETFLRMGVDFLSVVPACILPVRKALRDTDLSVGKALEAERSIAFK